ncbi:ABC transporter substrate-binding protein [Desulfospira joergensenii]|uniref:ABC transporter substrate-binding protein n=1 Tax=Desulfospira joergensenii TaxID=53329 RepID=UPI0003B393F5|nr:ABC transporter substrate-binding protein [Desulfospira joergensenii]
MKKTSRILLLLILAAGFLLPGVGQAVEQAKNQNLKLGLPIRDIRTLDPAFSTLTGEKSIVGEIFSGLLRMPYGKVDIELIQGDLAEKYDISPDGLVWKFTLRKGVKWHRGYGEVTSEDVKYTFERVKDPELASPWAKKYDNLDRVEIVDKYNLKLHLKKPNPFFGLSLVPYHGGQIVCRKAAEKMGKEYGFSPIGSGPFMFEAYDKGQSVYLKRNPDFYRGAPILKSVDYLFMPDNSSRLLAIEKGEVDISRGKRKREWAEATIKKGIRLAPPNPPQQQLLIMNMTRKPLDDLRVRKAIAYAVDRDTFVDIIGPVLGGPQISPIPPGYFGHTEKGMEPYDFDLEKAKALLAEAGYADGFDLGSQFCSESDNYLRPMKIVQEQLRQIGIKYDIKVVDHSTYHKLIRQDKNALVIYGGVRLPIAETLLTQFYAKKSIVGTKTAITNFSHYGEAASGIDQFLEKAQNTNDLEQKKHYYEQAQYKIIEDLPVYPLYLNRVALCYQPWVDLGYDVENYQTLYYTIEISEKTRLLKH